MGKILLILALLITMNGFSDVLNDDEIKSTVQQFKLKPSDRDNVLKATNLMNRISQGNFFIAYGWGWDALFYGKNSCRIEIFEKINGQTKKRTYLLNSSNFTIGASIGVGAVLILGTIQGKVNLDNLAFKEFKSGGIAIPLYEFITLTAKQIFKTPVHIPFGALYIPDHFEISIGVPKDEPIKMVYSVIGVGPHGTAGFRISNIKFGKKLLEAGEEDLGFEKLEE